MRINLTPMRRDDLLELSVSGDALTVNGELFDFAPIPEGAALPRVAVACPWLASDVERSGGKIALTLILPHGTNAPEETLFPAAIDVDDGPVTLPSYELEEEE